VIVIVSNSGKFLIHVPLISGVRARERFRTVGQAAVRIAELLGADIEVSQRRNLLSVWVYYKNGGKEWSPVYFDWGKDWGEKDVFKSIRSEVGRLFAHHESFVLQSARIE